MSISNLLLTDLNFYASHTFDQHHVFQLDVSFDDRKLVSFETDDEHIEEWTVDPVTAIDIGWDLLVAPRLKAICIQQTKKVEQFARILLVL